MATTKKRPKPPRRPPHDRFRHIGVVTPRSLARWTYRGRHGWRSGPGYTQPAPLNKETRPDHRAKVAAARKQNRRCRN